MARTATDILCKRSIMIRSFEQHQPTVELQEPPSCRLANLQPRIGPFAQARHRR